ncbi:hypothetical protein Glove_707g75 [Diversispora epigaea]|uniref:Uncharacterized protein n=1 Tax=Diversispora epigaea TaxID=1348612 RepID=A0A397G493_9GLOM|nr:hypothetical protein Glove_707g75 [Diversispora epigaea]
MAQYKGNNLEIKIDLILNENEKEIIWIVYDESIFYANNDLDSSIMVSNFLCPCYGYTCIESLIMEYPLSMIFSGAPVRKNSPSLICWFKVIFILMKTNSISVMVQLAKRLACSEKFIVYDTIGL